MTIKEYLEVESVKPITEASDFDNAFYDALAQFGSELIMSRKETKGEAITEAWRRLKENEREILRKKVGEDNMVYLFYLLLSMIDMYMNMSIPENPPASNSVN